MEFSNSAAHAAQTRPQPLERPRRTLIRGSLAVGLAAPTISRGFAKTGQALRIGYILPVQSQLGAGATTFADEIAKRTAGRITLQQFPELDARR